MVLIAAALTGRTIRAGEPSVLVKESAVRQRQVSRILSVYGRVRADPDAVLNISLPHAGMITRVAVRLGQRVRRGETLLEQAISPDAYKQYVEARSAVAFAQLELARRQRLFKEQLSVKAQVNSARKALADARAALKALEARQQNRSLEKVTAPTDGIVTTISVKQGDRVQAGVSALAVATGDRLIALFGVEPEDISTLRPGIPVVLSSVFIPDFKVKSRLREIHAMIDPSTHLVDVLVPIPRGKTDHLLLGMRLTATIPLAVHNGVTVPADAVLQDRQGSYVFLVDHGRARRVQVITGLASDTWIEIKNGLKPGEKVVSVGNYELRDGMAVREGG